MSLISTLFGDIPGLLRNWSPVLITIDSDLPPVCGVVVEPVHEPDEVDPRCLVWHKAHGLDNKAKMFVALDLTDPTGRVHAAWWCDARLDSLGRERGLGADALLELASAPEWYVCGLSQRGEPMTPEQIDTLARLVLRLAGRIP